MIRLLYALTAHLMRMILLYAMNYIARICIWGGRGKLVLTRGVTLWWEIVQKTEPYNTHEPWCVWPISLLNKATGKRGSDKDHWICVMYVCCCISLIRSAWCLSSWLTTDSSDRQPQNDCLEAELNVRKKTEKNGLINHGTTPAIIARSPSTHPPNFDLPKGCWSWLSTSPSCY